MFSGLKLYTIHTKPASDATLDRPLFIREGFNFFAFLFTFVWALYHRCYTFAAIIFSANVTAAIAFQSALINEPQLVLLQFTIQILAGMHANDVWRARLARRGYIFQDISSGSSLLSAEQRYFDRLVAR